MMDPDALGRLQSAGRRDPRRARPAGLRRGRCRPRARLRDRARRQRHDDRARPRHRPRAARRGAVRDDHARSRRSCWPPSSGCTCTRGARAAIFPALGAYVGGDIVAGMLATGMDRDKRTRLFIDVGTNCEIVLGNGDTIVSTAAPAGPAFEGGAIRCGMRAADGAIEVVKIADDDVELGVIGDVEPEGLCGSGLVDAVAELVKAGLLDGCGRFVSDEVARESRPAWPTGWPRSARSGSSCCTGPTPDAEVERLRLPLPARRPRAAVRQGRDRHRLDAAARGARRRARRRPAGAARRLVRQLPLARPPRCGSAWCPSCPCCASSRPATSPARARRWPCCPCASAPAPPPCWRRWSYVELSDRPDFNDRFVEQLAFPELTRVALDRLRRDRPARRADRGRARAGRSTCTRCRRCCTTSRS